MIGLIQLENVICLITSMLYVKYQKRELTQFNNVLHIVKLSYLPCLFSFFIYFTICLISGLSKQGGTSDFYPFQFVHGTYYLQ